MTRRSGGTTGTDWLASRRRYRRLSFGVLVAGVVGLVLADAADRPVAGVGIYWLGFVGFFAVRRWAPMTLSDERDCALERRASYDTVRLVGLALVVLGPAAAALEEVGYYDTPAVVEGALLGYAALFAVFAVAYLGRRYRP